MSENIKQRSFPRRLKLTTKVEDQFLGVQSKEDDMTSQSKNKRVCFFRLHQCHNKTQRSLIKQCVEVIVI